MMSWPFRPRTTNAMRAKALGLLGLSALCLSGCHRSAAPAKAGPQTPAASSSAPAIERVDPQAWRTIIPTQGTEPAWEFPVPTVSTLPNGLRVCVLPRKTGPVSLSLVIAHGASDVPPQKAGLANLAADLMAEATQTKNHYELSEAAESLGSTLQGDANRDYVSLSLDTLAEDASRGIQLLAEAYSIPALSRADFSRLQKQHLDDLIAERQAPARLASLVGLRAVLGPTLGEPVGGRLDTVRRLTVEDVRDWHRTFAVPEASALIVLGPVAPEAVLAAAQTYLGKIRARTAPTAQSPEPPATQGTELVLVDRPGSVQSALFAAQLFPRRGEPGCAARKVLDNVIGGQFTSRVNQNLREQHAYTYGARSTVIATRHFGLFAISTSVETQVTSASIRELLKELREIKGSEPKRPILMDELLRARTGAVQNLGAHLEAGHRLVPDLEELFVYGLPVGYYNDYLGELRHLQLPAVSAESDRLSPDNLTVVVVGDAGALREPLRELDLRVTDAPAQWLE